MPDPHPTPLGLAAEEYARSGWFVFPLKPGDKKPATANGLDAATVDINRIRSWWAKTPAANIGLNCGKSGIVVVDLDKHDKSDGLVEWQDLKSKYHFSTNTSESLTGGGGRHLLFKAPQGIEIKSSVGRLAPGIDVRSEGGYVVLPPSIHPNGKPYEWAEDTGKIETLPEPVIDILTHEQDPWRAFTLRDAFAPRAPLVWIVDNIISAGSLTIWFGSPGTLKSMLLTDLSVCVATGRHWLTTPDDPQSGIATVPTPIMWLDFDNGERRTHERFAALARARKLNDAAPITYYSMPSPRLAAGDTDSIHSLLERIVGRDVGLLVIDNLGKISGGLDENSADMQMVMDGLRHVAENGPAVIVIHHQRKSSGENKNARAGETLRGHSSIEAAIDLSMQVSREEETVTVTPVKTRGHTIKEFSATFSYENDEYHELTSARFWPVDMDKVEAEEARDEENFKQTVLDEVRKEGTTSATKLFGAIGGNRTHLFEVLRQLKLEKKLLEKPNPRGGLWLYLP